MPKRKATQQNQQPERPVLTVPIDDARRRIEEQIGKGHEIVQRTIMDSVTLLAARTDYTKWYYYTKELLTSIFSNNSIAEEFASAVRFSFPISPSIQLEIKEFKEDTLVYISRLESFIERLEFFVARQSQSERGSTLNIASDKVFIVHGHNGEAKEATARFISKLGLEPVILHEQANAGRTLIEKFEENSNVGYAVVLLTPDDIGGPSQNPNDLRPRARQNVIFELGYFIGALGRQQVCALYTEGVELPSDMSGVVYVPMDSAGGWHLLLARELKHAGLSVDLNDAV